MKKLIALFSIFAFNAMAQAPDAVLFKISDVKPVKNDEDATISCEYNLTMYNRSNENLANTTIALSWNDNAVLKTIETEKKASARSASIFNRGASKTQELNKSSAETEVSIGAIPAKKQIVSKQSIATDKCFLLLNPATFVVKTCRFENPTTTEQAEKETKAPAKNCNSMFSYVDISNPEYYTKFSNENYDASQKKQDDLIEKEMKAVDELYNKNTTEMKKLVDVIKSI